MSRGDCRAVKRPVVLSLRSQTSLDSYNVCSFTSVTRDSCASIGQVRDELKMAITGCKAKRLS